MGGWRSEWAELQKAIDGNAIGDKLMAKVRTSHRRSSRTKFVVSEQQMYLAQTAPALAAGNATATVKQIHDGDDIVCQLDEVKHWYTMENGSVTRECNFTQLVIKSIQTDGWRSTLDEEFNPISYARISDIYARHGMIKIIH